MHNESDPDPPVVELFDGVKLFDGVDTIECCAACRFWRRDDASKGQQGELVAECRRFPPTAVLVTQMQIGPRGPEPIQFPGTVPTATPATQWCGEFKLRLVPPTR